MIELNIHNNDRILIIAPHPDDECIGAGGILALYPTQCDVWVMTDGRYGSSNNIPHEMIKVRKKEFELEMKLSGVKNYKMFNIEDGTLLNHIDIVQCEDLSKYTKIFVTNELDEHADHRAAFRLIKETLIKQNNYTTQLYQYEISTPLRCVTHYVNITDVYKKKSQLISVHKSQHKALNYTRLAESLNAYRGVITGIDGLYAEGYLLTSLNVDKDQENKYMYEERNQKLLQFYRVYDMWLNSTLQNKKISEYILKMGYKNIAIYGYGSLGKRLYQCIKADGNLICVKYIMDKAADKGLSNEINIVCPSENLEKVEIVIVTPIYYYKDISEKLNNMGYENVISLEDIVCKMAE